MILNSDNVGHLEKLKRGLQAASPSTLEQVVAALIGRLLGVGVAVAKSGFQHGGDAGTAGRQGRHLRIECKRYLDTTPLSERELLGEVDQANLRDAELEAWILVATREVPEQLEQALERHATQLGLSIVVIDWKEGGVPALAALCASAPDLVKGLLSTEAATHADELRKAAKDRIDQLRRDVDAWAIGFERLRALAQERLARIWNSRRASQAALNQDVAGGETQKVVARPSVSSALDTWWSGPASEDSPAAIVGSDGVGKTWIAVAWLVNSLPVQPIVLVCPSSSMSELTASSEASIKRYLATRLHDLASGLREMEYWLRRIERLLKRPSSNGPVFTLLFDGLNQEPSVPWVPLLKTLQGEPFAGRVRVMISTRKWHFEDRLGSLRGLVVPSQRIQVAIYDDSPGGELDQRLALDRLSRHQLHPDLLELARTPRLFNLVVRFREQLVESGEITRHRLLWEYGRDSFGERTGRSFSEDDWRAWLGEVARAHREGAREYSVRGLGEMASRRDLSENEVYARLSDVIDGRFATQGPGGALQFRPDVLAHALGSALLAQLSEQSSASFEEVDTQLQAWLDPIDGLDQRAEILRAAVSILLEQNGDTSGPQAGALVTAWLQTQNLPERHRQELAGLANRLVNALLDAIEHSASYVQASARHWAVRALGAIPRRSGPALEHLVTRSRTWIGEISRDVAATGSGTDDAERRRAERLKNRIGVDASGPVRSVGVNFTLVDSSTGLVARTVPALLQGFPLQHAMQLFETAAVAQAVSGRSPAWDGLKWLCLLNEVDPEETTNALRSLSASVAAREAEPGVNESLPARVGALLLWLTGRESDALTASKLDPGIDRGFSYERDYLANPGRSLLAPERRHAEQALLDASIPVGWRAQRLGDLWLDPDFEAPAAFVAELRTSVPSIDVSKLDCSRHTTGEDHSFEQLEPAMARCGPGQLAEIIRTKLKQTDLPIEARHVRAFGALEHFVLAGLDEAGAATLLRRSLPNEPSSERWFSASLLLVLEIQAQSGIRQIDALMGADLDDILLVTTEIQNPISSSEAAELVARHSGDTSARRRNLICLLPRTAIRDCEEAWCWILSATDDLDPAVRRASFRALAEADGSRFGRHLIERHWSWSPDAEYGINHYGSGAIIEASSGIPFDQLVGRLAPWRILEAVRVRGEDPEEARLAASILSRVMGAAGQDEADPGASLTVSRTQAVSTPYLVSIELYQDADGDEGPLTRLQRSMDLEAQREHRRRAEETAKSRIETAWKAGANLYLSNMNAEDMIPVVRHAPEIVKTWLQGAVECTDDFRRRAGLADGAFLALCEALLLLDPARGVTLWRALRRAVRTRFIGKAGVDDMIHMAFRVPASAPVGILRQELLSLRWCSTDKDLFDVSIAAHSNGRAAWLQEVIVEDASSQYEWRRRRAVVLEGFAIGCSLPQPGAWSDGLANSAWEALMRRAARSRFVEACARYWWQRFVEATDATSAYAAWVLLLRSVDRRAWAWLPVEESAYPGQVSSGNPNLRHAAVNRDVLKRWMKKRERDLENHFLGQRTCEDMAPWT